MNAKQAKQNKFAKCKQTGLIWPYEYAGFKPPQRFAYIKIVERGEVYLRLARGYDVSTEIDFLDQIQNPKEFD